MPPSKSCRVFLQATGATAASVALGGALGGCASAKQSPAPLSSTEQVELTASQAVQAIRDGRLSAETYTATLVARAEALTDLNGLIFLNKAGALTAARRIDALRASGAALPPLAGLPIVVKDNINTSDMPTTGGTPALRNVQPLANSPTLQRLLGKV